MRVDTIARKVGPGTSRAAARKIRSVKVDDVYKALRALGRATCEQVILKLKDNLMPGETLREDPISGMFNQMCQKGLIVPTGKFERNTSGMQAIVWRLAKPEEAAYLKEFVGPDTVPWPSPDTLLQLEAVRKVLRNHENVQVRKLYRRYRKAVIFRTEFKDKGIKWLMANYEASGKKRNSNE